MAADTRQLDEKLHTLKAAYDQQLGPPIGVLESALAEITAAGDAAGQIAAVGILLELAHKIAGWRGPSDIPNSAPRHRIWKVSASVSPNKAAYPARRTVKN